MLGCHTHCQDEEKCVGFNYRTTKNVENCQLTNVTKEREKTKTGDWMLMLDVEAKKNEEEKGKTVDGNSDGEECPIKSSNFCHKNAICANINGSHNCSCLPGYAGDGKNCTAHELDSVIMAAESPEFTKTLAEWLPVTGNWSVCWRATRDGNKSEIFHDRCDSKVPTLTVVKVLKDNKSFIFGGFATVKWEVTYGTYVSAPGSLLFSFRNNDDLPPFTLPKISPNNPFGIQPHQKCGPRFGGGPDLSIVDGHLSDNRIVNVANIGYTYQAPPGYAKSKSKTQSLLAGSLYFTPVEVEVLYLP
ncbi:uncharacterized protein LOC114531475 [Dendronephthya gigantea]|uniref:uncharacterized protein LOC114531475 n=1 Tax=Dendronephthya gigantea TaxID=151771 RepID=UPI00106A1AEA|nr:uncharacterized protein LOC114531475 [Dendronephthya gigantea]